MMLINLNNIFTKNNNTFYYIIFNYIKSKLPAIKYIIIFYLNVIYLYNFQYYYKCYIYVIYIIIKLFY